MQLDKADKAKLVYTLNAHWKKFENEEIASEYFLVHVTGEDLCADMVLDIKDSRKGIEDVLQKSMLGYKGAELEGLQYDVIRDNNKTIFVFREVIGIND